MMDYLSLFNPAMSIAETPMLDASMLSSNLANMGITPQAVQAQTAGVTPGFGNLMGAGQRNPLGDLGNVVSPQGDTAQFRGGISGAGTAPAPNPGAIGSQNIHQLLQLIQNNNRSLPQIANLGALIGG